ncbi:MAG: hypothetical protein AB1453_03855 [Chloroflexota bacterium]
MLREDDYRQMRNDLDDLIADARRTVTLRRNDLSLPAQEARAVRAGSRAQALRDNGTGAARQVMLIYGPAELDIQRGDRFTLDGVLYEVIYVRSSRLAGTVAEAEAVQ